MKHLTHLALLLVALLLSATAHAYDFEVNGIYYNIINGNEAEVSNQYDEYSSRPTYSGDVTIPTTVTYNSTSYLVTAIGHGAFSNCEGLTSIDIPSSVTLIGYSAFRYCSNLTSITLPDNLTQISSNAFCFCTSLASITIPESVTTIEYQAFEGCASLKTLNFNAIRCEFDCSSDYGYIFSDCPLEIVNIGNQVTLIPKCFVTQALISDISIPESVTTIGEFAFADCDGLKNITIPNSVTTIDWGAFVNCSNLTSVTLGNSVASIGDRAFAECDKLTSVIIPNSVTTIGFNAFEKCTNLTSMTLGNSVTTIGSSAFAYCNKLTSVIIPNSVTTIGDGAFQNCTNITSMTLGNSVTTIGSSAFAYCDKLTSVIIPNSVTTIGFRAFGNCTNLTSVTLGNSVATIGYEAFNSCNELTSITVASDNPIYDSRDHCNAIIETTSNILTIGCKSTFIPSSVTAIGDYAFYNCAKLTCVTIPNSVTTIGNSAFSNCNGITSITIPNSVTTIGNSAFSNCNGITNITIPNSVTTIGNSAFASCPNLKNVYSQIENPSNIALGNNSFYLNDSWRYALRTLHIPLGSTAAYQASDWYKYFGSFIEMDNGGLITSIELDKKTAIVIEGETLQLAAIIMPEDATNKAITWASSNPNVATVDENGLVTAVGLGTATITAMTTDGSNLSASCQVTVTSESTTCGFVIRNAEVLHGESIVIPVAMVNDQPIFAFQTDVYLPEGFSLATNPNMEPVVTPSERLTSDHVMMTQNVSNGAVRVMCYTPNAMPIEGDEGDLFYITVMVPNNAEGDYAIYLRNTRLTTTDYTELRAPDAGAVLTVKAFIPGDANDSHSVNVADIVSTAMYVMNLDPSPFIFDAADMNSDGEITVTDIMLIANLILHPEVMNAPRHAPATGDNNNHMSGKVITEGKTHKVSILLDNETDYCAFQFDLTLPEGFIAYNFQLTDRVGNHTLDVNTLANGKTRVLCYSTVIQPIDGHEGEVLTFEVTSNGAASSDITVDDIELVTTACEMVRLNAFNVSINNITAVNEVVAGKSVARVDYYNLAGQRLAQPERGVTLQVTTYTDGFRTTTKLHK